MKQYGKDPEPRVKRVEMQSDLKALRDEIDHLIHRVSELEADVAALKGGTVR